MLDLLMSTWATIKPAVSWLGKSTFWAQAFATVVGAWIAFWLEHKRRERERSDSECAQVNALLATLGRMLTTLENLNEVIPPLKEGKPTADAFKRIQGLPQTLPRIDFEPLVFFFNTRDKKDPFAKVYGRLAHAQESFDTMLELINERNRLVGELLPAGSVPTGEAGLVSKLRQGEVSADLHYFAVELVQGCEMRISLFKEIFGETRKAAVYRYNRQRIFNRKKRQFIGLYSRTSKNAAIV